MVPWQKPVIIITKRLMVPIVCLWLVFAFGMAAAESTVVRAGKLTVTLSDQGEVVGAVLGDGVHRAIRGRTLLANCRRVGPVVRKLPASGGVLFTQELVGDKPLHRCTLRERYLPAGETVRWEIEILGTGPPWSTAIETQLVWPAPAHAKMWVAGSGGLPATRYGWNDPLQAMPFAPRTLKYGGYRFDNPDAISLPLVTVLESATDQGLSLALSPEDLTLDMILRTGPDGTMTFSRLYRRIEAGRPIRFAMDLVAHSADWRAGIGWLTRRYPAYFDPPNPRADEIAGCGAYSSHADNFDAEKLRRMAFRVNWRASFDFPYMGMFIPPVGSDTEEWIDFKQQPTSIREMADYAERVRALGFYVLSYFNVTEFGAHTQFPAPSRKAKDDADLWKDAQDYLYYVVGDGILLSPEGKPYPSWEGCVAMDPGEPSYQKFLLEQAQRHIDVLPGASGICIDRMDWLAFYNTHRDDGVSWYKDAPARALVFSWHDIMSKLGPMMHHANKVIYCNPHYRRLDLFRHIDGVYDEFGQYGFSMNLCAFLTVRKPLLEWTIDVPELRNDPDGYFQRHLYMGAFLTAPVPGNDHTILPDPEIEKHYLDYGPLLDAMRGRKWVLRPHVVDALADQVKVNLFELADGYVLPVTFGGDRSHVKVVLRGLTETRRKQFRIEALQPAVESPVAVPATAAGDVLTLDVPLVRGCAMVRLVELDGSRSSNE